MNGEKNVENIFNILAEYVEELKNSPDLNNKPAKRRRLNPIANPYPNSTSVSQCNSTSELSPGTNDARTMDIEESVAQLSIQNSPQEATMNDDVQCSTDFQSVSEEKTSIVESRQFINFNDSNTKQ